MDNKYTVGIITASDKGSKGEREDISGRRIREILPAENYEVVSYKVLPEFYIVSACFTAMALWRHKANIKRLLTGTENKFGMKKNQEE